MSSDDTYIGNNPATGNSKLFFHQYLLYDNLNWTASGNVCYDAVTQSFYVVPFPQAAEVLAPVTQPVAGKPGGLSGLKKK